MDGDLQFSWRNIGAGWQGPTIALLAGLCIRFLPLNLGKIAGAGFVLASSSVMPFLHWTVTGIRAIFWPVF